MINRMATHKINAIELELDTFKDSMWRLTNRVHILENFIKEKFGKVLLSYDAPIKENTAIIDQEGRTLRRKIRKRSPVQAKNKKAKHIPNSKVDSEEEGESEEEDSNSDGVILNSDAPVIEKQVLTAKVRTSTRPGPARRTSSWNVKEKYKKEKQMSKSESKGEVNGDEEANSDIDIKEEYAYVLEQYSEEESDDEPNNDPDFIVNQLSPDGSTVSEVVHKDAAYGSQNNIQSKEIILPNRQRSKLRKDLPGKRGSGGRYKSLIWDKFLTVKDSRTNAIISNKCKQCNEDISARALRMERHVEICKSQQRKHSAIASLSAPAAVCQNDNSPSPVIKAKDISCQTKK